MSDINITVEGNTSKRLKTAGKYCDRDIVVTAGGDGIDTSDATAVANDIAMGQTAYVNGQKVTGNIEIMEEDVVLDVPNPAWNEDKAAVRVSFINSGDRIIIENNGKQVHMDIPGVNLGNAATSDVAEGVTFTSENGLKLTGTKEEPVSVDRGTPTIGVSTAGLISAIVEQEAGLVDAGTKVATKQLPTKSAETYTPTTSDQTISELQYLTGAQTIKGDANLEASNIKSGVSIFNTVGTYEGGLDGTKTQGMTFDYTITNPWTYGFDLDSETGYYVSNNMGVKSSYALCKIDFVVNTACNIEFNVINSAETGFDYGIFGNLDTEITDNEYYKSYRYDTITNPQTLTYLNVPAGSHYIYVKYVKDSSTDFGNDSLSFRIVSEPYVRITLTDDSKQEIENAGFVLSPSAPGIMVDDAGLITSCTIIREGYFEDEYTSTTYQLPVNTGSTYIPRRYAGIIARPGQYLTGAISVSGDDNLVAENIASGVSIFGVTGTYTGSASIGTASVSISTLSTITAVSSTRVYDGELASSFINPNTTEMTISSCAIGSTVGIAINSSTMTLWENNGNATYKGAIMTDGGRMEFWQINGDCSFGDGDG